MIEIKRGLRDANALRRPKDKGKLASLVYGGKKISYNLIELNREKGENLQAEFLAINPFGKLPALIDSSILMPNGEPLKLFESGAILLHLA